MGIIFGPATGYTSSRFMKRFVRNVRLLQSLSRLDFDSCLDVGGGQGYSCALVERLFRVTAVPVDLSVTYGVEARKNYGLESLCVDAHQLPFRSESFDVVISSETIEHLLHPVEAILEMIRVAKKAVLVSTCEAYAVPALAWISSKMARYEEFAEGGHVNFFRGADFRMLMGDSTMLENQFIKPGLSRNGSQALRHTRQDPDEIKAQVRQITWTHRYLPGSRGVVALRVLDPKAVRAEPRYSDEAVLEAVLLHTAALEREIAQGGASGAPRPAGESLRDCLQCPRCGHPQELEALLHSCARCSFAGSTAEGVPVLTPGLEAVRSGPIDRTRHAAAVARAGLSFESMEWVKRRIERRKGVKNRVALRGLRAARKLLRWTEGAARWRWFLRDRIRRRADRGSNA